MDPAKALSLIVARPLPETARPYPPQTRHRTDAKSLPGTPRSPQSSEEQAKSGPKIPQDHPKNAQERPRAAQERPKSGRDCPKTVPRGTTRSQDRLKNAPRTPKTAQERPKTAPRAPKSTPRPPNTEKRPPGPPQKTCLSKNGKRATVEGASETFSGSPFKEFLSWKNVRDTYGTFLRINPRLVKTIPKHIYI